MENRQCRRYVLIDFDFLALDVKLFSNLGYTELSQVTDLAEDGLTEKWKP